MNQPENCGHESILTPTFPDLQSRTYRAIGKPLATIGRLPLYSKLSRDSWLKSLYKNGKEGLLFTALTDLEGEEDQTPPVPPEDGFDLSYWNENSSSFVGVGSHLCQDRSAGLFTSRSYFPVSSPLSGVMCAIANLLSVNGNMMVASLPQLFVGARAGFSPEYYCDNPSVINSYRCFMFLGGDIVSGHDKNVLSNSDIDLVKARGQAFIVSHSEKPKHLPKKVMSLKSVAEECKHKHVIYPGDIVVASCENPYVVELPIVTRMRNARILSWVILQPSRDQAFPCHPPKLLHVPIIENIVSESEEAKQYYEEESEIMLGGNVEFEAVDNSNFRSLRVSNESDIKKIDRAGFNITEDQFYIPSKNTDVGVVGSGADGNVSEESGQKPGASMTAAFVNSPSDADGLDDKSLDDSYTPGDELYDDEEVLDGEDGPDQD